MSFSPSCLAPSARVIGLPRLWSPVLASAYSTSANLYAPSPLKMDAKSVQNREWARRNPEIIKKRDIKWLQANPIRRREWKVAFDQRTAPYRRLYKFLVNYQWPLQHLTWKTHIPVMSQKKVKRACSSCGRYESQGLRLWWKRRHPEPADAKLYDCFACFYTFNPGHVAPIEYGSLPLDEALRAMQKARKQHVKSARETTSLPSENDKPR